jgi:two-component system response regulator
MPVTEGGQHVNSEAPVDVLLVEDDLGDVLMVEEALDGWRIPTALHVANDGVEATAFLRREGLYAQAPRPAFVLLDLNLPRKDGFQVLEEIKNDAELSIIPIVVFSTSEAPEDVLRSYSSNANAYVIKPTDFDDFARVVREIDAFYTQVVSQPSRAARRTQPEDRAEGAAD